MLVPPFAIAHVNNRSGPAKLPIRNENFGFLHHKYDSMPLFPVDLPCHTRIRHAACTIFPLRERPANKNSHAPYIITELKTASYRLPRLLELLKVLDKCELVHGKRLSKPCEASRQQHDAQHLFPALFNKTAVAAEPLHRCASGAEQPHERAWPAIGEGELTMLLDLYDLF